MSELATSSPPESVGRYLLYPAIARGGMATVHTARLVGAEGFTRLVAAKRLHPQFTDDPDFVTMFHDEACIASRIHHPNVVPVLDVVMSGNELILVQEYVHGVPLSQLVKVAQADEEPIAIDIVIAIITGVLAGLHAAHEVRDEADRPLDIVHRDVSPQNVMVSVDGIPRLLDFGIAKARTSTHHTREGVFKGKLAYMSPELLRMDGIDRTVDIYATGVLLWELLVNRRVNNGRHELDFVNAVVKGEVPSVVEALEADRDSIDDERWAQLALLEPIVSRAMAQSSTDRYATAADMMHALLQVRPAATAMAVAEWVRASGAEFLDQRQKTLAANEESWRRTSVFPTAPSSGRQRIETARLTIATPSAIGLIPRPRRSSPPPLPLQSPPTQPSAFPVMSSTPPVATSHSESGAYRVALGVSPLGHVAERMRRSRALPFVAAGLFMAAGALGGLLRGGPDPAPTGVVSGSLLPAGARIDPNGTPASSPAAAASEAAKTSQDAIAVAPIIPAAVLSAKASHVAPPPPPPPAAPPPRTFFVARPPAPPPHPVTTTQGAPSGTADCNPPFYFEGPKKVFKPSCL